jgi:hypothetical protein
MGITDRFPAFAPPTPADEFQKPKRAELLEAEAESERKPGQIDIFRLMQFPGAAYAKSFETSLTLNKGGLPFAIAESGIPSTKGWGAPTRCTRLMVGWQGFLLVRECRNADEARAVHAELEKFLLAAEK